MPDAQKTDRDLADAKAWFYLDHRGDIETWAALRCEGRQLIDTHLVRVADDLEALALDVHAEFETRDLSAGGFPRAGLRKPAWQRDGETAVSVVAQWDRGKLLTPGTNEWPWVAVFVATDTASSGHRQAIAGAVKPLGGATGRSSTHPYWRSVQPLCEGSVDPEALLAALVAAFRALWDSASPVLDELYARYPWPRSTSPTA